VSRVGYFFEGLNIFISTCKCINFLFASLNYLLILKLLTETLLRIPFAVIGRCSLVTSSHWHRENAQELTRHRRLPVWFYKNHRCLPGSNFSVKIAALRSLKRVTWRIFKISKYVISKEQAKTLSFNFNYQRMYRKYLFVIRSKAIQKLLVMRHNTLHINSPGLIRNS